MKRLSMTSALVSILFFAGPVLVGCAGPGSQIPPSPAVTQPSNQVPIAELVANPEAFDGRRLCTSGVSVSGFEASSLGVGTVKRDGLTYLEEPTIWIEGGEFLSRQGCFTERIGPQKFEFCQSVVCGRFERCQSCGAGGGAAFQIVGVDQPVSPVGTSVAAHPVNPTPTSSPTPVELVVKEPPGPDYEVVFAIPVGENGVQYRGVGVVDMLVTGPNALAVLGDGTFVIADLIGNRLLRYSATGRQLNTIDLSALDIVNVSDLQAAGDALFLKEISGYHVAPARSRMHRLSPEGELLASYDIPDEFRLADNLPGVNVDGEGRIVFEAEGRVQQLVTPGGDWALAPVEGLIYYGRAYRASNYGEVPTIFTPEIELETRLTDRFGGLQILGALPDGHFYAVREDLVSHQPWILVDQTIHFVDSQGMTLGVARYPLSEAFYIVERHLALGPDGAVYGLMPAEETLQVIRLNFYTHLEPLIPDAVMPQVSVAARP